VLWGTLQSGATPAEARRAAGVKDEAAAPPASEAAP
jgi:hypothetical protein